MPDHEHEWWWYGRTDGSDGYWFCDKCGAEHRPNLEHPTPPQHGLATGGTVAKDEAFTINEAHGIDGGQDG